MLARASLALLLTLTACGGDDSNSSPADASVPSDTGGGSTNSVQTVTCPSTVALTVTTTSQYVYAPTSATPTISVGDVVHFMMASTHNAVPKPGLSSDPGLNVGFGGNVCLKFTKAGTFNFYCTAHNFSGAITVQ